MIQLWPGCFFRRSVCRSSSQRLMPLLMTLILVATLEGKKREFSKCNTILKGLGIHTTRLRASSSPSRRKLILINIVPTGLTSGEEGTFPKGL